MAATVSLLGVIAASIFAHDVANPVLLASYAAYWSALVAITGLAGALLRAEARRLHASRQLLIAR